MWDFPECRREEADPCGMSLDKPGLSEPSLKGAFKLLFRDLGILGWGSTGISGCQCIPKIPGVCVAALCPSVAFKDTPGFGNLGPNSCLSLPVEWRFPEGETLAFFLVYPGKKGG